METLFLAFILLTISILGLFASGSFGSRAFFAFMLTGEAFAIGWILSMFGSAMAAWNRYGEPSPPFVLATLFAIVTALVTFPIASYRPKRTRDQQSKFKTQDEERKPHKSE